MSSKVGAKKCRSAEATQLRLPDQGTYESHLEDFHCTDLSLQSPGPFPAQVIEGSERRRKTVLRASTLICHGLQGWSGKPFFTAEEAAYPLTSCVRACDLLGNQEVH